MADFAHVENDTLRAVLEGRIAPLTATLNGCLEVTFTALGYDLLSRELPFEVLQARSDAANSAEAAYDDGDNAAALAALRQYWSI
jgi:hypothetical protein